MSKFTEAFESRGIEYQYNARTPQMALRAFATSCNICCTRGMQLDCDKCGIEAVHNSIMLIKFNKRSVS